MDDNYVLVPVGFLTRMISTSSSNIDIVSLSAAPHYQLYLCYPKYFIIESEIQMLFDKKYYIDSKTYDN